MNAGAILALFAIGFAVACAIAKAMLDRGQPPSTPRTTKPKPDRFIASVGEKEPRS